jgi:hypothetical protein
MATDFRAMLIRHSWLVQFFGSYVYGPERHPRHNDHFAHVLAQHPMGDAQETSEWPALDAHSSAAPLHPKA